jgi:hypothetical protein
MDPDLREGGDDVRRGCRSDPGPMKWQIYLSCIISQSGGNTRAIPPLWTSNIPTSNAWVWPLERPGSAMLVVSGSSSLIWFPNHRFWRILILVCTMQISRGCLLKPVNRRVSRNSHEPIFLLSHAQLSPQFCEISTHSILWHIDRLSLNIRWKLTTGVSAISCAFGSFLALNGQPATIEQRNNPNVDDREKYNYRW